MWTKRCLRRKGTDILYVGESSLDLGKQTVGKTTCRQNERLPSFLSLTQAAIRIGKF